jgi:isoleucyl-tRNA synthetase
MGPRFGKLMKEAAAKIVELDMAAISELEQNGTYSLTLNGTTVEITLDDVEIVSDDIPGLQVASMGSLTVALDTTISPELREEGIARELINRIQNLRKDNGYEVTDKIEVILQGHDEINLAVKHNLEYICSETLAQSFDVVSEIDGLPKTAIELTDTVKTFLSIRRVI